MEQIKDNQGKLGVFWHTQGCGKSFSMVFFSRRCCGRCPATGRSWSSPTGTTWTTRSTELRQHRGRAGRREAGPGRQRRAPEAAAEQEDHRYVFTLIQKFRTEARARRTRCSPTARDIIVITDEAHRSQYDTFAPQHAERPAERRLHRLHRHAADGRGGDDQGGLRRLRLASTTSGSPSRTGPRSRCTTRTASPNCS